jgi:hypothetical protein
MKTWKEKKLMVVKEKKWNTDLGKWNKKMDSDGKIS